MAIDTLINFLKTPLDSDFLLLYAAVLVSAAGASP